MFSSPQHFPYWYPRPGKTFSPCRRELLLYFDMKEMEREREHAREKMCRTFEKRFIFFITMRWKAEIKREKMSFFRESEKTTTDKDFSLTLVFLFASCYKDTLTNETIVPKFTINGIVEERKSVCAIKRPWKHEGKNLIIKGVGEGKWGILHFSPFSTSLT